MNTKLVYISGNPFWFTPEGLFMRADVSNENSAENILFADK